MRPGDTEPRKVGIGDGIVLVDELGFGRKVWLTDERCRQALVRIAEDASAVVSTRDPIGRKILHRSAGDLVEYEDGDHTRTVLIQEIGPGPVWR